MPFITAQATNFFGLNLALIFARAISDRGSFYGLHTDVNSAKYKVENSNPNIGDILKEQGVRIDDLMALRDSLMKGLCCVVLCCVVSDSYCHTGQFQRLENLLFSSKRNS